MALRPVPTRPGPARREEAYASPLRATSEQLQGLPPALLVVAANDILRDGGEACGLQLDAAGRPTTTVRYDGMIHDFGLLNALAHLPPVISSPSSPRPPPSCAST